MEETLPVLGIRPDRKEALKIRWSKQTLLVYPQRQFSVLFHLPEQADQTHRIHTGQHLKVVGVDAGEALGVGIGLASPGEGLGLFIGERRYHLHVEAHGLLPQQALVKVHLFQNRLLHSGKSFQPLQHGGVAGGHMGAAAQQTYRNFPGNLIQVGPGGHALLGQSLLVPAHAQQIRGPSLGQLVPPAADHLLDGRDPCQRQAVLKQSVEQQVHVGVMETGEHLTALQVGFLVPGECQGVPVAAHKDDGAIFYANGLLPVFAGNHGVHLAVIPESAHENPSIFFF